MAPAIHFLEESVAWVGGNCENSSAPPPAWEWVTAAAYSCARSCGGAGLAEEQVVVQNE
jgi:hypothetical protein